MRLLNTETYDLVFFMENAPPYAILSHTWGDEEVTLQEVQRGIPYASALKGFAKIAGCCAQARRDGYAWAWVDTCCIDKTSSAELSEAINSMYQWYRTSAVCYVYMIDVVQDGSGGGAATTTTGPGSPDMGGARRASSTSPRPGTTEMPLGGGLISPGRGFAPLPHAPRPNPSFAKSRWFSRGWTLQELVAPRTIIFYDRDWNEVGTKTSLASELRRVTGVRTDVLHGAPPSSCTVGERMSWAAHRQTTRQEDRAYSLLGIFDVNMPLLYGEGERAFIRLQEEILRRSEDLSLLGWTIHGRHEDSVGVLAQDPSGFTSVLSTDNTPLIQDPSLPGGIRQGFTWQDVKTVPPGATSTRSKRSLPSPGTFADEPPVITSRGILVTLLVQRPEALGIRGHDGDLVAWIFLRTRFSEHGQIGNDDVSFCVLFRPVYSQELYGLDGGYLVANRAASGMARGLICVSQSKLSQFIQRKVYLSYSFQQRDPRVEWAISQPNPPLVPSPVPSWRHRDVRRQYNALSIHLHPEGGLKILSYHPKSLHLVEAPNSRYELQIERQGTSLDVGADEVGQVSFLCGFGADSRWRSISNDFVVEFAAFTRRWSHHFHCAVHENNKAWLSKANPESDRNSFWRTHAAADGQAFRPVDRAHHQLGSGHKVSAAIREHVQLVRHDCRFVNVALHITLSHMAEEASLMRTVV